MSYEDVLPQYRTFWPRFCAGIIDGLIFLPLGMLDKHLSEPSLSAAILITWACFYFLFGAAYVILMHYLFGQTIGKMVMRVKVLDISETRLPTLWQAFIRDIGDVLSDGFALAYFVYLVGSHRYAGSQNIGGTPGQILGYAGTAWFLLEVFTMLLSTKRRAFHDVIAGTVVVYEWRHSARRLVARWRGRIDLRRGEPSVGR
jgi:uncharacterized RDD family membrane protein YckC